MYSSTTLIGRLGKDVELKTTNNGKAVAKFSLATTEGSGDKQTTEWHYIVAWEKTAELCAQYIRKGSLVSVIGRISSHKYTDKNQIERIAYEIVASRVVFLSPKSEGQATKSQLDDFGFPLAAHATHSNEPSLEDIPF